MSGKLTTLIRNRNECKRLIVTAHRKEPDTRYEQRVENNIKKGHRDIGCEGEHWIEMTQDSMLWRTLVLNFRDH
jgi:hypothetical protein